MELTTHLVQESRPTRLFVRRSVRGDPCPNGTLTLYGKPLFQVDFKQRPASGCATLDYNPNDPRANGFQFELFPLPSMPRGELLKLAKPAKPDTSMTLEDSP